MEINDIEKSIKQQEKENKKIAKKKKKQDFKNKDFPWYRKVFDFLCLGILFASVYFSYELCLLIDSYEFLPSKYLKLLLYALCAINIIIALMVLPYHNHFWVKFILIVLASSMCYTEFFALNLIPTYKGKMERIFTEIPTEGEMNINVYAMATSNIEKIEDIADKKVGVVSSLDADAVDYAVIVINSVINNGKEIETIDILDLYEAVEKLYNNEIDVLLLNEDYASIVGDNADFTTFDEVTKVVYTCIKKMQLDYNLENVSNITQEPFIIGLAGNDKWGVGNISTSGSRTDVNMIVAVNPINKEILLISIPRDSYVMLYQNKNGVVKQLGKDKLTHSSIKGIGSWVETINNLLDVKVNYYVRVNFSSVVEIIDSMGGVDINNPYAFQTIDIDIGPGQHKQFYFEEGELHLSGIEALSYLRERKHLKNGDFGRNEHQQIILKAMVNKVTQLEVITNISEILNAAVGKFVSNVTMDDIFALAQMQLNDMAHWKIYTANVTGSSYWDMSYYMGRNLSMVKIDEESLNTAIEKLHKMMNGESIAEPVEQE